MSPRRNSQLFSLDFVGSVSVFLVFFIVFYLAYSNLKLETSQAAEAKRAEDVAATFSDELVLTAGVPSDWNSSTIVTLGLASEQGVLSRAKLDKLANMSYSESKNYLILGGFDYFLNLTASGKNEFSYGEYPQENASSIVPISRYALLDFENGTRVLSVLKVVVWKE